MELLAFFTKEHHLFKSDSTFNLGGEFLFKFELVDSIIKIEKLENSDYISNFYGDRISNITAIVGDNGVGKTSVLKILNQEPKHILISIFIYKSEIIIRNQSDYQLEASFEFQDYLSDNKLYSIFYSGHQDYNSKIIPSVLNHYDIVNFSLTELYYERVLKQLFFLNQKGQFLKENFETLPFYENLVVEVNNVRKEDFLKSDFYDKATIGKKIHEQLKMLWQEYAVLEEQNLTGEFNFINNFEVFILSLLVSDDSYGQTNDNGDNIAFEEVLRQDSFRNKLESFLKKRLDNIDKNLYKRIIDKVGISFDNIEDQINLIKSDRFKTISGGFDFGPIKNHAIYTINRFYNCWKLYEFIESYSEELLVFEKPNQLQISVQEDSSVDFLNTFIELYQQVEESFQYISFQFRIFNIFPNRRLSTGELSLLNFYSSFYSFTRKSEHHLRKRDNYLLLLDEPETGYHAFWKKKFIKSITSILPELFKELNQLPKIQIIFTTHDALTLSDIPNNNIVYLSKDLNSKISIYHIDDDNRPKASFGANITDLLADSFFIKDGLIGDFAKEKINETLLWLNFKKVEKEIEEIKSKKVKRYGISLSDLKNQRESMLSEALKNDDPEYHKKLIALIDEPILKIKMLEMYSEVFGEDEQHSKEELVRLAKKLGYNISRKADSE